MTDLPVDIDATYADDPQRPGRKAHQEHHDKLHAFHNGLVGSDPIPMKVQDALAAAAAAAVDDEASARADADSTLQANLDAEAAARADADTAEAAARAAGDDLRILLSEKGAAGGVAPLDGGGKLAASFLPSSVMEYQGVWNAATNTPTLADGAGSPGDVYRVTVAGTRNLGSGAITFDVGDYAVLNASLVWEKSDTTDSVPSVDGLTGNVDLTGRYQAKDADLDAIAALSTTTFGRALLALADAAALRTSAGLVIGTDVQGHDVDLDSLAAGGSTATTWLRALLDTIYQAAGPDPNYRTLASFTCRVNATQATPVPFIGGAAGLYADPATTSTASLALYDFDPSLFTGGTVKCRLLVTVRTNQTAPGVAIAFGLAPLTPVTTGGGVANVAPMTAGTRTVEHSFSSADLAASTTVRYDSGDFDAPAAGLYGFSAFVGGGSGGVASTSAVIAMVRLLARVV